MAVCSICGCNYSGYGNNAYPVNDGRCCDSCNGIVITERLRRAMMSQAQDRGSE